jgi:hypothetical protein
MPVDLASSAHSVPPEPWRSFLQAFDAQLTGQREDPISEADFDGVWKEFEQPERDLREERKKARAARESRKAAKQVAHAGWAP